MLYLGVSYTIYSDVIDSFILRDIEVQILDPCVLAQKFLNREIHTLYYIMYITQTDSERHFS